MPPESLSSILAVLSSAQLIPTTGVDQNAESLAIVGALMMFMLAGFGLMVTGLCRAKNAAHAMSLSFLVYPLVAIAFFVCGFAFMCGGTGDPSAAPVYAPSDAALSLRHLSSVGNGVHAWGLVGTRGTFLSGVGRGPTLGWFFLMLIAASIATIIPTGACVERWKFRSFFIFTLLMGSIIFPLYGCWIWGGGWLAQLGVNSHLGHGVVDYAGSSVIHLLGGSTALAAVILLGPRLGKYDMDLNPRPILGHHVPMVMLGTFIIAFTWFALNTARSLVANDGRLPLIVANTALCAAGAAVAAAGYMWWLYGRPDPSIVCNGMLGGLVASSAGCAFVTPGAALGIGMIAGLISAMGVLFFERRGIDDPVGAVSVHGLNGVWGMLALGLLADGTFGSRYNGVASPVTGLFYGGGAGQLVSQLIGIVVCIAWGVGSAWGSLTLIAFFQGTNRVTAEVEIAGLDIPELGAPGYPEFISHVAPEQVPSSQILAARMRG